MIIKKEIKNFKKIYIKKSNYGIVDWKKEQKELIKEQDNISIVNQKERILLDLNYEKQFGNNEIVIGKDLLLQFTIVITSIISSTILAIMVFLGDVINGFVSRGDITKEAFGEIFKKLVEDYVRGTLDVSVLVIIIIAMAFGLLLLGEVLFVISKIVGKKDLIIIRRYYECMIELLEEEIEYREKNGIHIMAGEKQVSNMSVNSEHGELREKINIILKIIKKYWMMGLIFAVILVSFIPVILLNTNYKKQEPGNSNNLNVDITGTYVEWLGALSPLVLGVIAVSQSDRLQKLEEGVVGRDNSCSIILEDKSGSPNGVRCRNKLTNDGVNKYEESEDWIVIAINNYSDAFLKEIEIDFGKNIFHSNLTAVKGKEKIFKIYLPKNFDYSLEQRNRVIFTSCYDVKTYGDFVIDFNKKENIIQIKQYHFWGIEETKTS